MKKASFLITVPKPCSENWDLMAPADKGRYCAACQKNVVDFSVLTDREIIAVIKEAAGGELCGHFHSTQLQHQYTERETAVPLYRVWLQRVAAVMLFFETIGNTVWAQTVKPRKPAHAAAPVKKGNVKQMRAVNGSVRDYATNEPLPGMVVQIKGTELKTTTDKSGKFYLPLPDSFHHTAFTLTAVNENHADYLQGTTIPDEELAIDSVLLNRTISLYRYPVETLQVEKVVDYRPVITTTSVAGGMMVREVQMLPITTRHWWWPFHRKLKQNE